MITDFQNLVTDVIGPTLTDGASSIATKLEGSALQLKSPNSILQSFGFNKLASSLMGAETFSIDLIDRLNDLPEAMEDLVLARKIFDETVQDLCSFYGLIVEDGVDFEYTVKMATPFGGTIRLEFWRDANSAHYNLAGYSEWDEPKNSRSYQFLNLGERPEYNFFYENFKLYYKTSEGNLLDINSTLDTVADVCLAKLAQIQAFFDLSELAMRMKHIAVSAVQSIVEGIKESAFGQAITRLITGITSFTRQSLINVCANALKNSLGSTYNEGDEYYSLVALPGFSTDIVAGVILGIGYGLSIVLTLVFRGIGALISIVFQIISTISQIFASSTINASFLKVEDSDFPTWNLPIATISMPLNMVPLGVKAELEAYGIATVYFESYSLAFTFIRTAENTAGCQIMPLCYRAETRHPDVGESIGSAIQATRFNPSNKWVYSNLFLNEDYNDRCPLESVPGYDFITMGQGDCQWTFNRAISSIMNLATISLIKRGDIRLDAPEGINLSPWVSAQFGPSCALSDLLNYTGYGDTSMSYNDKFAVNGFAYKIGMATAILNSNVTRYANASRVAFSYDEIYKVCSNGYGIEIDATTGYTSMPVLLSAIVFLLQYGLEAITKGDYGIKYEVFTALDVVNPVGAFPSVSVMAVVGALTAAVVGAAVAGAVAIGGYCIGQRIASANYSKKAVKQQAALEAYQKDPSPKNLKKYSKAQKKLSKARNLCSAFNINTPGYPLALAPTGGSESPSTPTNAPSGDSLVESVLVAITGVNPND